MDDRNTRLDAELEAIYAAVRGDVPADLHGRVVRSIEACATERPFWRRAASIRSAGAALAVVATLAVAVAALPWVRSTAFPAVAPPISPSAQTPSSTPPESAGAIDGVRAFALGPGDVNLEIAEVTSEVIPCGESRGFAGNGPWPWHVTASAADGGSSVSADVSSGGGLVMIDRPGGWITAESATPSGSLFAFCDAPTSGTEFGGRFQWTEHAATVVGTRADAAITATIKAAEDRRLVLARQWVAADDATTATFDARASLRTLPVPSRITDPTQQALLEQNSTAPGLAAVQIDYEVQIPRATHGPEWVDVLVFDLLDGHAIGVDELFSDPAAGLDVLSSYARKDPGLSQFGKDAIWTAGTAPTAANFAMWAPSVGGLEITFPANQVGPSALGTRRIVVPWSALAGYLKPDSSVRNVIP